MTSFLLRSVEVDGRHTDVRVVDGVVHQVGPLSPHAAEEVVDGRGGTLVPGLHDHHVHLRALAARRASVVVGPPEVTDAETFARRLRQSSGPWVRAVGYHESVAGLLDRDILDRVVADRPVRVQHRGGALWALNSAALRITGADDGPEPGIERDADGRATGRLWRMDDWLRGRVPPVAADLAAVGEAAARAGVTGFTDATPGRTQADVDDLAAARLPQRLFLMAPPGLSSPAAEVTLGPCKVVLDDDALPSAAELAGRVRDAHDADVPIAVHAVTLDQLAVALAALEDAGPHPGDRIEHAGVVAPAFVPVMRRLGVTVVTQPAFVAERGDEYRRQVAADEQAWLYPCASLRRAGIPVAAGTDAPFGDPDPWRSMAAAVARTTPTGHVLGAGERVDARTALDLFLGEPQRPGTPRRVAPGTPADLCLLRAPLAHVLAAPSFEWVVATWVGGRPVFAEPGAVG